MSSFESILVLLYKKLHKNCKIKLKINEKYNLSRVMMIYGQAF